MCSKYRPQSQCFYRKQCDGMAFRDCLCVQTGESTPPILPGREQVYDPSNKAHCKNLSLCHFAPDFCTDVKQQLGQQAIFRNKCSFTKDCLFIRCENSELRNSDPESKLIVCMTKCMNAPDQRLIPSPCASDLFAITWRPCCVILNGAVGFTSCAFYVT